jgi:UDP-N-acetylglucosamine/UDP-N-acetylgalactosamine diphosphorylase
VGVFVVAGGQGTRLGFDRPKGAFPVGPVTSRSLFEIQAQKIRGLVRRLGAVVPWYVMTSPATDAETRALFDEAGCFGLDPADVMIFSQDVVPACDFAGRLILEAPHRIAESPNGHGGALLALQDAGALDDMARRGVDRIFYYQVDNPLVRIADPVFLGFHDLEGAQMSCKVIRKADPDEKVGVVATRDGRPGIVEYTELQDPERSLRDDSGALVYWAGSIAIHVLDTDFVRRVGTDAPRFLPYHASAKKIPTIDSDGRDVAPDEPNGYKLERFVFDALPAAERVCVLEVRPEEDFSPIKNAEGKDSPASARSDLDRQYRGWLAKAGVEVPADVSAIEIDHAQIDSAAEATERGIDRLEDAGDVIRVATGMDA